MPDARAEKTSTKAYLEFSLTSKSESLPQLYILRQRIIQLYLNRFGYFSFNFTQPKLNQMFFKFINQFNLFVSLIFLVIFFLTLLINQYLEREGEKKKKKETQQKAREAWTLGRRGFNFPGQDLNAQILSCREIETRQHVHVSSHELAPQQLASSIYLKNSIRNWAPKARAHQFKELESAHTESHFS